MNILGIDPSLSCTGYAVIDNQAKFVKSGTIPTSTKLSKEKRLLIIFNRILEIAQDYKIGKCAIEEPFVSINKNTALKLASANAVILVALASKDIEIFKYPPRYIKKFVTGDGAADKKKVRTFINMFYRKENIVDFNESDALAAAFLLFNTNK